MSKRRLNRRLGVFHIPTGIYGPGHIKAARAQGFEVSSTRDGITVLGRIGALANWVTAEFDSEMVEYISPLTLG